MIAETLACLRGGRQVFAGLGFSAAAGEALLLTGPNGAGKTSLLRLLAGLVRPAAGQVRLEPADPERTLPEQAHYLGHLDPIKRSLSVAENLRFWAGMLGGGGSTVDQALAEARLAELADLPAGFLSAGQRRRLSMARLLVADRPIWLLDEPTVSLDAASTELLARLIQRHLAAGGLVIAATHLPLGLEQPVYLRLGPQAAGPAAEAQP